MPEGAPSTTDAQRPEQCLPGGAISADFEYQIDRHDQQRWVARHVAVVSRLPLPTKSISRYGIPLEVCKRIWLGGVRETLAFLGTKHHSRWQHYQT